MNAVEKLEAAIAKLEELREASTKPTGAASWYQGQDRKRYEGSREVYSGPDENAPGSQDIVRFAEPEDAELVVVLYRTIDAQLAVMLEARSVYLKWGISGDVALMKYGHAYALADAILGVSDADVG